MLLKFQHENDYDFPHNLQNKVTDEQNVFSEVVSIIKRLWKRLNNLPSAVQHDAPVQPGDSLLWEISFLMKKKTTLPLHVLVQFLEMSSTSAHGSSLQAELLLCFSHFV